MANGIAGKRTYPLPSNMDDVALTADINALRKLARTFDAIVEDLLEVVKE